MFFNGAFPEKGVAEENSPEMVAAQDLEERTASVHPQGRGRKGPHRAQAASTISVRVEERLEPQAELMDASPTGEWGSRGPHQEPMDGISAGEGGSMGPGIKGRARAIAGKGRE